MATDNEVITVPIKGLRSLLGALQRLPSDGEIEEMRQSAEWYEITHQAHVLAELARIVECPFCKTSGSIFVARGTSSPTSDLEPGKWQIRCEGCQARGGVRKSHDIALKDFEKPL